MKITQEQRDAMMEILSNTYANVYSAKKEMEFALNSIARAIASFVEEEQKHE